MRRRRRRSAFAPDNSRLGVIALGVGAVILIAAFLFFMHQSDVLAPPQHEVSTPLPDAFSDASKGQ